MPDTGNVKDCFEVPLTNFSIFTLKNVTWRTYLIIFFSTVLFSISFCLYRACFTHLISSNFELQSMFMVLWSNWSTLIKKLVQTYIVIVSGTILNVSTVHFNGIWHLVWLYLSKPVLGGHPLLSGHYSIPQGCPLNTGFTVCCNTLGPDREFSLQDAKLSRIVIYRSKIIRMKCSLNWSCFNHGEMHCDSVDSSLSVFV